jgi:hypothetical protein
MRLPLRYPLRLDHGPACLIRTDRRVAFTLRQPADNLIDALLARGSLCREGPQVNLS